MPFRILDSCLLGVAANRAWELLEHPEKSPWNGMLPVGWAAPPPVPEASGAGPVGFPPIPAPEAPELEAVPPPLPAASGVKKIKHSVDELLIKHACEFELVAHPWVWSSYVSYLV